MSSKPAWWLIVCVSLTLPIGVALMLFAPDTLFRLWIALIMLVNLLQLPRVAWGFQVTGQTASVTYPLWPPRNRTFSRLDIQRAQLLESGSPLFKLRGGVILHFVDGSRLRLRALGTSNFDAVISFVQPPTRAASA